jgi:hypothetical protein
MPVPHQHGCEPRRTWASSLTRHRGSRTSPAVEPNIVLPLASSVVSFVFAAAVLAQWRVRHRAFQLVWGIGLLWYGVSAGTEWAGSAFGWSEPLYRVWYLIGALFVAAYLGMGTVYLLSRTRFGYFVAATIFAGGLFAVLSQLRLEREGRPADPSAVLAVIGFASIAALVTAYATWRLRPIAAHLTMGLLVVASLVMAALVLTVPLQSPGYALDPQTRVPIGSAIPPNLRITSGPFNITGAFTLVFGALFSAYVFMPKRKLMRHRVKAPVVAQMYGAAAVIVNLLASLPLAARALLDKRLHSRVPATLLIALGGFIPGITSGLNRFGITWSFFLGEFLGVVLIFAGFLVSTEVFSARVAVAGRTVLRRGEAQPASRI